MRNIRHARRGAVSALPAFVLVLALTGTGAAAATDGAGIADSSTAAATAATDEYVVDLVDPSRPTEPGGSVTGVAEVSDDVAVVGVTWEDDAAVAGEAATARLRVSSGQEWGPWEQVGASVEVADGVWASEPALLIGAEEVQVAIAGDVADAELTVVASEVTEADRAAVAALPITGQDVGGTTDAESLADPGGPGGLAAVGTRADWGADESLWDGDPVVADDRPRLGVTVHHTAGTNDYTPEQVPSILRSIHRYHAVTLGWGDVGYHAMVDRYGRVWEGRAGGLETTVQGAHASGMNTDWFGISVLGDFETSEVPPATLEALSAMSAAVLDRTGAGPDEQISYTNAYFSWTRLLGRIHGHGDVGTTACPGWHLDQQLDTLRSLAAQRLLGRTGMVQRLSGADRYAVSAQVAAAAAPDGARTAYLAQGSDLADALGVGPLAGQQQAAVLLARQDTVPLVTSTALEDLGVGEVVVVGGEVALAPEVVRQLTSTGVAVRRVEGQNRYATAVALSRERAWTGNTVYLASGVELADALGGAAAAAHVDAPMLLTKTDALPEVTGQRLVELAPSRVVVLGGPGAIEQAVVDELTRLLPGATVDRLGGDNRYATSALVALDAFEGAGSAVVANGAAPVDAMVGTQLAAAQDAPVVLTRQACRPGALTSVEDGLGVGVWRLTGGASVLDWSSVSLDC